MISFEAKYRGASQFSLVQTYAFVDQDGSGASYDDIGVLYSNYSYNVSDINGNINLTGLAFTIDAPLVCFFSKSLGMHEIYSYYIYAGGGGGGGLI